MTLQDSTVSTFSIGNLQNIGFMLLKNVFPLGAVIKIDYSW